jgi:hypothetical protein
MAITSRVAANTRSSNFNDRTLAKFPNGRQYLSRLQGRSNKRVVTSQSRKNHANGEIRGAIHPTFPLPDVFYAHGDLLLDLT